MLDRIHAAYKVLRGTHKAVPMEATWYVVNHTTGGPPGFYLWTTSPNITTTFGGSSQ